MTNILIIAVLCLTAVKPNEAEFKAGGAVLRARVESGLYSYSLVASSSDPIIGFRISQHAGHGFLVPDGWDFKQIDDELDTWALTPQAAITSNKPGNFSFQISTRGAVLGQGLAVVKFKSGRQITMSNVWTAKAEPPVHIAMVVAIIIGILVIQTVVVLRKRQKAKANSA
jgi:hypothetical protein